MACLEPVKTMPDPTLAIVSPDLGTAPALEQPVALGVMASGNGSNFEAIATAIADQQLNAQIRVLIYNNPGAKVAERAARYKVPAILLDHRQFPDRESLEVEIIKTLQAHGVEWVVMAGWMRRVTQVLIDAFPDRILNIHPSLLPSFRGMHAVEQALAAGVMIAGCTVHYVRLDVDSGPIVMQAAVPVLPGDTAETLQHRIHRQEHRIFPTAIAIAVRQAQGSGLA